MKLKNKSILITGGGTGIGRACAELFAAEGANIIVTGRRLEPLQEVEGKISAEGVGKAIAVQGDVTELEDLGKFISAAVENFGRIDALVNNAGVFAMGSILDITPDQFDHIFDINVKAPLMMTKLVAQAMIEQGDGGSILNISSTVGSKPAPYMTVYAASKAALNNFTRSWALELSSHQIRVNVISPGVVDTEIHGQDEAERAEAMEQMAGIHPLGRVGKVEEIAAAALYFVADDSAWTTGTNLDVDGGINAGA